MIGKILEELRSGRGEFITDNMVHRVRGSSGRLFIESFLKEDKKNWVEVSLPNNPIIETTVDLPSDRSGEVYLNRMDSYKKGYGYGTEFIKGLLIYLKGFGYKNFKAYTEFQAVDSRSILKKLGFKEEETKDGSYLTLNL